MWAALQAALESETAEAGRQLFDLVLAAALAVKVAILVVMARDLRSLGLPWGALCSLVAAAVIAFGSVSFLAEWFGHDLIGSERARLLFGLHALAIGVLLLGIRKRLTAPAAAVTRRSTGDGCP